VMYGPCTLYSLLSTPTKALYIYIHTRQYFLCRCVLHICWSV
jgi:hypothetical protein